MHCKAGRGRSTTLVMCYLIKRRRMAPSAALALVRGTRPQVHLAQVRRCGLCHRVGGGATTGSGLGLLAGMGPVP